MLFRSLQMTGDSDADWAGDAPERESITGNPIPLSKKGSAYTHESLAFTLGLR